MTIDKNYLVAKTKEISAEIIGIRRKIHQNPELGFEEKETAELIAKYLKNLGLEVTEGIGGTGVVALLKGGKSGVDSKTIAVRADMDALPIQEENDCEYASKNIGKMHACGHDAHVAMVLGLAKVLAEIKAEITGTVKFIFQPSEESPPGGAIEMIKDGVLENPKVDAMLGVHVTPSVPAGFIGYKEGTLMAATDMFEITLKGKGGHGAIPHHSIDTIVLGAQVIQALQNIASRRVDPLEPVVLTIGTVKAGVAPNVIPGEFHMAGTVRTLDPNLRQEVPKIMKQIIGGIMAGAGGTFEFKYDFGYPALVNNTELVEFIKEVSKEVAGTGKVFPIKNPSMGGEDFAYFAEKVPACYFFLGVGFKDKENYSWHHPKFDLDESSLPICTAVLAYGVLKYLTEV